MKLKFRKNIDRIWYRNSLQFDYWKFLRSDIDITILLATRHELILKQIAQFHFAIRKIFPVIGEVIFYHPNDLNLLSTCINPTEAARDPILVQFVKYQIKPNRFEKAVFLHKFIISNWDKKYSLELKRADKISYYLKCVEKTNIPNLEEVIFEIFKFSEFNQTNFSEFKKAYIEELTTPSDADKKTIHPLVYALFFNQLCFRMPNHNSDDETSIPISCKKIISATVNWELWGIYTYRYLSNEENLKAHFCRINLSAEKLLDKNTYFDLRDKIEKLKLI